MEHRQSCVLLVDDNPAARAVVHRQLETLGWDVVSAATGREAVRIAERGLRIEVLLTDLDLPDVHGVAVARAVMHACPDTRVAFMSGSAPQTPLEPRHAPFLLKPFSRAALANALVHAARE